MPHASLLPWAVVGSPLLLLRVPSNIASVGVAVALALWLELLRLLPAVAGGVYSEWCHQCSP